MAFSEWHTLKGNPLTIGVIWGKELSGFGEELSHPDFDWNGIPGEDWDYRFY
ncbi:MAG: hypothetical protein U9R53_06025 [Chloroflexota bacterium]|nr:hypothetical protein [Chloroflexota bacterium]